MRKEARGDEMRRKIAAGAGDEVERRRELRPGLVSEVRDGEGFLEETLDRVWGKMGQLG